MKEVDRPSLLQPATTPSPPFSASSSALYPSQSLTIPHNPSQSLTILVSPPQKFHRSAQSAAPKEVAPPVPAPACHHSQPPAHCQKNLVSGVKNIEQRNVICKNVSTGTGAENGEGVGWR
jgi:hypothetical protein